MANVPYLYNFNTSHVSPKLTWSISEGSLPPGITLSANTGLLSGTTTSSRYNFTITADNGFAPPIVRTFTTNDPAVFKASTGNVDDPGRPHGDVRHRWRHRRAGYYSNDGVTDITVFRPSNGTWYIRNGPTVHWGQDGDIPVPADYNGDGQTDIAVFRPSTGFWYIQNGQAVAFGAPGDIPTPGDFDGDGRADIAVYRPSTGQYLLYNGPTTTLPGGGKPVPGYYFP